MTKQYKITLVQNDNYSILANAKTVEFTKKPSKSSIMKAIKLAFKSGYNHIDIVWGENAIEISRDYNIGRFIGYGWIGNNSGQDIANDLKKLQLI